MKRTAKKALAAAAATAFLLAAGGSAQAGGRDWRDGKLRYEKDKIIKILEYLKKNHERPPRESPIPEPSAALVFGAGLLVASRFARKAR